MKNLPVLLMLIGLCSPALAQPTRVILLRDTSAHQLNLAELDKKHPALQESFRNQPQGFFDAMRERHKQLDAFMKKRTDVPQKAFGIMVYEYYQPNGIVSWALLQPDRPLPDSVLTPMIRCFQAFYTSTPYPATGNHSFRVMTMMQYGKTYMTPRTVRKGPGIISTLDAARNTTRPDTVTMLAFNQLDLTNIPDVVYRFPKLEELDLSKNSLHELPARLTADIPTLKRLSLLQNTIPDDSVFFTPNTHLIALNLQKNKLTRIPTSVRQNRRLESLWIGHNALAELDTKTLRRLRRLNDLNLYSAGLTTLPRSIKRLKRLNVLDLYYNKLTELPRQLGRLKRLEQLAVSHNDLSKLPDSFAKLRWLQELYVHHNRLSQLPAGFERLRQLRVLDLSHNWYSVAPDVLRSLPQLEELSLNNNNLQEFPTAVLSIKNLRKLFLTSNPVLSRDARNDQYAPQLKQLEANHTQVTY